MHEALGFHQSGSRLYKARSLIGSELPGLRMSGQFRGYEGFVSAYLQNFASAETTANGRQVMRKALLE